MIKAVFWDFGGVLTASPFHILAALEKERGLPEHFVRQINSQRPDDNAWAQVERNEITLDEFDELFAREARALGGELRGHDILPRIAMPMVPEMVSLMQRIATEIPCAGITNNIATGFGPTMQRSREKAEAVAEAFAPMKFILESWRLGMRKPEPEIFELALEMMDVKPEQALFLDDLGINLKPARAMGMHTIKVTSPEQARHEVNALLGMTL